MIVKKMPILQGFPDFETVKFFTGKFFQKYNFTPVFYDIETTGLSRNSTYLYLIGAVGIEDETWNFYQWMAENASEEETILRIFSQFLQQCDLLISYNGDASTSHIWKHDMKNMEFPLRLQENSRWIST